MNGGARRIRLDVAGAAPPARGPDRHSDGRGPGEASHNSCVFSTYTRQVPIRHGCVEIPCLRGVYPGPRNADNLDYVKQKLLSCRSCELDTSSELPLARVAQQPT